MKITGWLAILGLIGLVSVTDASTVNWGAQITNGVGTAGIGMANGTPLVNGSGDLALVGSFNITNAQIIANATNEAFLMSHFTTFGSATMGQGNPNGAGSASDGYWTGVTTNSAEALGIQNKEIYYWIFDTSNPATADQYGIFTNSSLLRWTFPSDTGNPNTTNTDLSDVAHDITGILFGSYGSGLSRDGASPLYNLGAITPVPEPSTWLAGALITSSLFPTLRRRFKK